MSSWFSDALGFIVLSLSVALSQISDRVSHLGGVLLSIECTVTDEVHA